MNHTDAINAIIDSNETLDFALRSLLIDLLPNDNDRFDDLDHIIDNALDDALELDAFSTLNRPRLRTQLRMIADLIIHARDAEYDIYRDELTAMLLADSLCPMHAIDYAICFDDDDDECAAIRLIHPSHDT